MRDITLSMDFRRRSLEMLFGQHLDEKIGPICKKQTTLGIVQTNNNDN